jgi:hypothetical protein
MGAPMKKITGKRYEIPTFAQHLTEFCDDKRGRILQKSGTKRLFRYRFTNPLLQPFVIIARAQGRFDRQFDARLTRPRKQQSFPRSAIPN